MKKIPTLFERKFENHKIIGIADKITPGCEEAFYNGVATVKVDGACCAMINGEFYKRYDAKKGKTPPDGAIPCCDPDPVTGHWPHWVRVNYKDPCDKWFFQSYLNFMKDKAIEKPEDGTYEAVGPHFNGNPHLLDADTLWKHGEIKVDVPRNFEAIKRYLECHQIEGLVFWLNDEPVCKIKKTDFGFKWPMISALNGL